MLSKIWDHLPDELKGRIDFYTFRKRQLIWGGPFKGQTGRLAVFAALRPIVNPGFILETGTCYGTTTELLAESGLPVVTIESNARNYAFARARLRRFANVQLWLGDSRIGALRALDLHRTTLGARPLFAYLDAHWNEDLPLAEELDVVFTRCPNPVVMVDDFRVPDDPGYGYDDFGPGKALDQSYIAPAVETHRLGVFYPMLPSAKETGQRRGCVVLAREADWAEPLLATGLLRRAGS
jgi:hypothetical protein